LTTERKLVLAGILYGAMAVFTFGHSAAATYEREIADHAQCNRDPKAICFNDSVAVAGSGGLAAAALWPLYWSWEIQQ
jgi:hypothetical protein